MNIMNDIKKYFYKYCLMLKILLHKKTNYLI